MKLDIDHIFIMTSPGAPEAEYLKDFRLTEGSPNRHPGQAGLMTITSSSEPLLDLGFEGETTGRHKDFRPDLPVVFHW